jgi:two-component system, cell cycle sensor histidine kinase and response regulator CckA
MPVNTLIPAQSTSDETRRIETLRRYAILDTVPEQAPDDLAALAAQICEAPIALISLVDEHRQWFKARVGFELTETPRDISFCSHAVHQRNLLIVPDATRDERFAQNPMVTGEPHIRFYAGAPLVNPEDAALGALCVMDRVPRTLTQEQEQALGVLARQVMTHLELRRHARELAESDSRFRLLAENITDVFWITSPDLQKVHYVSPGYERIWGRSADNLYSDPNLWAEPILPEEREHVVGVFATLAESKPSVSVEYRIARPGGAVRWIHSRGFQVRDAEGRLVRLIGIATDITERKETDIATHHVAALVQFSDDAIIGKDLNSIITSWNRGAEKIFGYTADEMVGTSITRLIPAERLNEENHILAKIRCGESVDHFDTVRKTKSGRLIHVSVTASPIKDSTGTVIGVSKVARDITERKLAQEQIAEQAALLEKARDAIIVRGLEGEVLFWNSGAERMYGWTRLEVIGRNVREFLYSSPRKFEEVNGLTVSQNQWQGELQHLTKDNSEITVEARWTLIRDKEGRPKSVLAINTDVTDKKKIEAQFMRAQRMESVGTLAGGIAHDLNNILAPIILSIDFLRTITDQPQAKKILETIDVSAKRGADIVRQVLSFARGLEGQRIEVQPRHLLKDLEIIIKDTFPKDIRLQFSAPGDTWTILGDPTQIHQILLNLSVNARDAMPSGGSLTVGVENCVLDEQYAAMNIDAKAGRYTIISVADSGTGIPRDHLEKIFEPFFTTKEINKGTGLGLSAVMAIAKSHGGFVNVYSELGKGTTFKVYLPATELSSGANAPVLGKVNLPRGNGETVLVVDDEASILIVTSQTLQAFGYRVLTATDGADAVAIYVQHKDEIAVVLTDMMMPVMDGTATIQALMRINPGVKIIAASGLNANGAAKGSGGGLKHFLTKPYTAETLLTALRMILNET